MAGEQTPSSRRLGECTSEEAFAAELQGQAERAEETKAPGHHRVDVEGQGNSERDNSPVAKGLISDARLNHFKAAFNDIGQKQEPMDEHLTKAFLHQYGPALLAEVKTLRNLVRVMDLAGGEAVRQRDEYAAEIDRLAAKRRASGAL